MRTLIVTEFVTPDGVVQAGANAEPDAHAETARAAETSADATGPDAG